MKRLGTRLTKWDQRLNYNRGALITSVMSLEAAAAPSLRLICGRFAPSNSARANVPMDLRNRARHNEGTGCKHMQCRSTCMHMYVCLT